VRLKDVVMRSWWSMLHHLQMSPRRINVFVGGGVVGCGSGMSGETCDGSWKDSV